MMSTRTHRSSGCSLVGLVALPLVVGLAVVDASDGGSGAQALTEVDFAEAPAVVEVEAATIEAALRAPIAAPSCADPAATDTPGDAATAGRDPLVGVWQQYEAHAEGDVIRFYYFHGDGHGLYRYGKVGLTNTHSFNYVVDGETLRLHFRKTAEDAATEFKLAADPDVDGRTWISMGDDPRGEGRYFRDPRTPAALCEAAAASSGRGIGNRLWSDERSYAAGGMGFAMYQLQPQTIDGRGVGWFHRGDFDEWTTEALTYRRQGDVLTLHFMLRGESETTAIEVLEVADNERYLTLDDDPRDYWTRHRYRDRGPSFAANEALGGGLLPGVCGD
ncbi:MAG: hypothetical protein KC486_30000 [Myxococcales bacterium]|nr:hypothetical protein [Myxococcales bacterium]